MQGEMGRVRIRVQKDCGCVTRFLHQPCHVLRKTLWIPDLEAEGRCCLKLFLAHVEASSNGLSLTTAERDPCQY